MTKVGFVISPLASGHAIRGIGAYVRYLLPELKKQAPHFGFEILEVENSFQISNFKFQIVHYPYFDLFFHTLPIFRPAKTVVTVHDVIPLEFPDHYPPGLRGWANLQLQELAVSSCQAIIADSQATAAAIEKYLPVSENKIHVVYLAAGEEFKKITDSKLLIQVKAKYKLPDKFVLYVGDVNWNKNIPNLILACEQINYPLVIVGKQATQISSLKSQIPMKISNPQNLIRKVLGKPHPQLEHLELLEKLFEDNDVMRLGFVPDEGLVAVYNLATVYCQPSFAEGFGLPVLEAMACGTPVACSRTHSLPEIVGDNAVYFDPHDIRDISQAIIKARPAGKPKFSWEETTRQTLEVYRGVL